LQGIDNDDIEVALKLPVLKAVIENKGSSCLSIRYPAAGQVTIGGNAQPCLWYVELQQRRFIA
jgi:hypothetical protein